ncbi:related to UPF0132 domain protein [Cephalotrichum gorgonifer]|uniref:Related to UPF0132 domain protein n=1 Tax=Cephalotrichum gorgonifer TaxID=2041049 RepID=A0AAE8SWX3_9PEZI|nr:related to UPF0132 domain protein [Cephalotrichum gorgonifer]
MDFAPYQSSPPETTRSPPPTSSPRTSADYRSWSPFQQPSPPPLQHPQPQRSWQPSIPGAFPGADAAREGVSEFDTSLGVRLDYEAGLAYLAFPPIGAILLLIAERNSDYVRFHAWQSSLVFTAILIFHLFIAWSSFLSWVFFLGDMALMAFLALRAYQDADTLDRYELPFFGQLATRFLDDE